MSQIESMSRFDLKERYPKLYQEIVEAEEIGPLKEQAIVTFDITRSPKSGKVRFVAVHYSDMPTMVCERCERTYSEAEYKQACKTELLPCEHTIWDCFDIDSYPLCSCGYYEIPGHTH